MTTPITSGATTFDWTRPEDTTIIGGYTRTTRAALTNDNLLKVKDAASRKILPKPIKGNYVITSFDPAKMSEKDNFFRCISALDVEFQAIKQHHINFHMHNIFALVFKNERQAKAADGTLLTDPTTGNPIMESYAQDLGDLFETWHNVDVDHVALSVATYQRYGEDIDRQSLTWSWDFFMANVDADMRHYLVSMTDKYPAHIGRTGPMAFFYMARKLITVTRTLAHNIVSGTMNLELRHFEGEDVNECVFVLRNILKFLNYGTSNSTAPPTFMMNLVDIFLRCSNSQFRSYIRNMRDFHETQIDTPEKLFSIAIKYYHDIQTNPEVEWLTTRKKKSAFVAGNNDKSKGSANQTSSTKGNSKSEIDRTPPKQGEPTTRKNQHTGRDEHWCSKCPKGGRWGNHNADGHDKWFQDFKAWKDRQNDKKGTESKESKETQESDNKGSESTPKSMRRSTPVASVLRRTYVSFQDSDDESE